MRRGVRTHRRYTVRMKKILSYALSAAIVAVTFVNASPAYAMCALQYPLIGTISSVQTDQYGNAKITLAHASAFNSTLFSSANTNIDQYNTLAAAFKQNGYNLPANYQYQQTGSPPQGYSSWNDYIQQNYNSFYVNAAGLSSLSYQNGDIVVQGPPGGAACTQTGFTGFFGQGGIIQAAIASDNADLSYTYGNETLSLTDTTPQYGCTTNSNSTVQGNTICKVPVTYSLNGNSVTLNEGDTKQLGGAHFKSVSLTQSNNTTLNCSSSGSQVSSCWIEDFAPRALTHVLTFGSSIQPSMCTPTWSCTPWSACSPSGIQVRTCSDQNSCTVSTGKPSESQSCTVPQFSVNALMTQIQTLLAQVAQLQKQVVNIPQSGTCPVISRSLSLGARGSDVLSLQNYFISLGLLSSDSATGYFGLITQGALQKWQSSQGVVSSGTPATTGYGSVGPRTLAAIQRTCASGSASGSVSTTVGTTQSGANNNSAISSAAASSCVNAPKPTDTCTSVWVGDIGTDGCTHSWHCTSQVAQNPTTVNRPPTISAIAGPTSLAVGTVGSWTIQATDPEGNPLLYSLSFGDNTDTSSAFSQIQNIALTGGINYSAINTFSHSYATAGSYALTAHVQDDAGNVVERSSAITVTGASSSSNLFSNFLSSLASTSTNNADIPPSGTLITMPASGKCPSYSVPIVSAGWCLSLGPPVPAPPPVCPTGYHQTLGAGCLEDPPPSPPEAPMCPSGTYETLGAGCLISQGDGTCTDGATKYIACGNATMCTTDPGTVVCRGGYWYKQ